MLRNRPGAERLPDEFFVLLKHYKPGGNRVMMKGYGPAPAERTNGNGGIVT